MRTHSIRKGGYKLKHPVYHLSGRSWPSLCWQNRTHPAALHTSKPACPVWGQMAMLASKHKKVSWDTYQTNSTPNQWTWSAHFLQDKKNYLVRTLPTVNVSCQRRPFCIDWTTIGDDMAKVWQTTVVPLRVKLVLNVTNNWQVDPNIEW